MQRGESNPWDERAPAYVRRIGIWSWFLEGVAVLALGAVALFTPPWPSGRSLGLVAMLVWMSIVMGLSLGDRSLRSPRVAMTLALGVLFGCATMAMGAGSAQASHPVAVGAVALAGVGSLAQALALWPVRRALRREVVRELDRVSPDGSIPFAPLVPEVARWCYAAVLLGIPWIIFGLLVIAIDGISWPGVRQRHAAWAFVAGWSGVAGGAWMLAERSNVARGLRGDAAALRRGLLSQVVASLVAGGPLYWRVFAGDWAGDALGRIAWCMIPLVPASCFALVLVVFGRAFAMRAELRRVEADWSRAIQTGPAATEAALRAQANALRQELGMPELRPPGTPYLPPTFVN